MTAPPGHPAPVPAQVHDQGAFARACARRDIGALQAALANLTKREACEHLAALFPHRTHRWFAHHLERITRIDPDLWWRLAYADPTGEQAVRRADAA